MDRNQSTPNPYQALNDMLVRKRRVEAVLRRLKAQWEPAHPQQSAPSQRPGGTPARVG